jgi:hypothetical protein
MGYIDTVVAKFIPPANVGRTAGTWTPAIGSNVVSTARGAADATFGLFIPIDLPAGANYRTGAKVKSIDVYYDISVEAADAFATVEIEKMTLAANTVAISGTTVACSQSSDAEARATLAAHKLTVTPTAEFWMEKGYAYYLYLFVDMGANGVFALMGAQVNYELRA